VSVQRNIFQILPTAMSTTADKPSKAPFAVSDLLVGTVINTLFTTSSLVDYSLDLYAREVNNPQIAAGHLAWKIAGPPVLKWITLTCLLMLPLAIFDLFKNGVLGVFSKKASTFRHALDVFHFCFLIAQLSYLFAYVLPFEISASAQLAEGKGDAVALMGELHKAHAVMFFTNLLMWLIPFARYHETLQATANAGDKKTK